MLLFNSVGPNPRVVRMFAAERGVELPKQEVDLRGGENRQESHLAKNPAGQLPVLQLDDGAYLSEIIAICEYLDETAPGPSLVGGTPEERAETRMWVRRIDLNIVEPLANGFRFAEGLKLFQNRIRCLPEAADGLKAVARDKITWLDGQMDNKQFICGNRFTLADVFTFCFLDFGNSVGQKLDPELRNLQAWFERVKARPSASA